MPFLVLVMLTLPCGRPPDFQDESGHGTHVCGTITGSPLILGNMSGLAQNPNSARGVAPGAKIAFFGGYFRAGILAWT